MRNYTQHLRRTIGLAIILIGAMLVFGAIERQFQLAPESVAAGLTLAVLAIVPLGAMMKLAAMLRSNRRS